MRGTYLGRGFPTETCPKRLSRCLVDRPRARTEILVWLMFFKMVVQLVVEMGAGVGCFSRDL